MWKKAAALTAALALLTASNLSVGCTVSVGGRELDGCYSPDCVDRAVAAAEAAAAEILRSDGEGIEVQRRCGVYLRRPQGETKLLCDALLRATEGVAAVSGVYVDGVRLGTVEDEGQLRRSLDSFIYMQQPNKAVRSMLNGELSITPFYSRSGEQVALDDMVLLITGKAHVMYMDENGRFV